MSNIAFNPVMSTNEIFRTNDRTRFLSNDLDTIETDIQALKTEKKGKGRKTHCAAQGPRAVINACLLCYRNASEN